MSSTAARASPRPTRRVDVRAVSRDRPLLLVTPGEPAGIGPDLAIALAAQPARDHDRLIVADPGLLEERARQLGISVDIDLCTPDHPAPTRANRLAVWPVPLATAAVPGTLDTRNAAYVVATMDAAVAACLDGRADALVTGPVQKSVINAAGIPFSGHTERLAEACGGVLPVMMLVASPLRVALATTHLPLRAVPDALNVDGLCRLLRIVDADLRRRFGISRPRISVCGLNPHAGESGYLGREEIEVIAPALDRLRAEGLQLDGPLPADTAFTPRALEGVDAVVAMYHDQGLPVLKHAGFGEAVNVTLGLPIVRTSVDHGTALDLAGSGRAEAGSLIAALDLAARLARGRA